MSQNNKSISFAILAATLYAINIPISKQLLEHIPAIMMAGFLYLGAGMGIFVFIFISKILKKECKEKPLTLKELPFAVGMIFFNITASICLMIGLTNTTAANASLINNFEIVSTSIIALIIFKERISKQLWVAIILITVANEILLFEDISNFKLSWGQLFITLACICWGGENNCTQKLSSKDPIQIVIIKGLSSGIGSIIISIIIGESCFEILCILISILLGFVSYGLSIYFYIYAQRNLGAVKTSAYYAITPFIGVILSLIIYQEIPSIIFIIALFIMLIGTLIVANDNNFKQND